MPSPGDDIEILSLLAESANDVIWKMAVTGEITYVSPSIARMRGLTPEEAMVQPLDEMMTPESVALTVQYFEEMYAALARGERPPPTYWGEREYYCKDGSTGMTTPARWWRSSASRAMPAIARSRSACCRPRATRRRPHA